MWVDACTLDLGRVRATVRANTDAAAAAVRDAFRAQAVDDPGAPKNFSVAFSNDRNSAHLLFWGGCVAARSFDPDRIVRSLADHLTAHCPAPAGLVWIESIPFVKDGKAVLMPSRLNDSLRVVDRQLREAGWTAVDAPRALVDLETAELVVADLMESDPDALAQAVTGVARRRTEPAVPYGRYQLDRWVFLDYRGNWGPIGRASATRAAMLEIADGVEQPDADLLWKIARLFSRVQPSSMFPGYRDAALDAVLGRTHEHDHEHAAHA